MGVLTDDNLIFKTSYLKKIGDFVSDNQDEMKEVIDQKYVEVFRGHPSKSEFDAQTLVTKMINDKTIRNLFGV